MDFYEAHANEPEEAIFQFATHLQEACEYVLGGAFRSVTIEGDLVALFIARDHVQLGKVIHAALNMAADDDNDAASITVTFDLEEDAFTMTALPITVLGDASLN